MKLRMDETLIRLTKLKTLATDGFYLRRFFRSGVAPAIEHRALLQTLMFDLVVDAGANRGQFSLVCRQLRPAARIVAFEPLAAPARVFRHLFMGDPLTELHEVALGPERGIAEMHLSERDDLSSLLPITSAQTENYPGSREIGTCIVAVRPLGELLGAADLTGRNLFKIDVQGFELEVLKSAADLLRHFEWIYVECSYLPLYEGQPLAPQVEEFLHGAGFALLGRHNVSYVEDSGEPLQADFLFGRI